MGDINAEAHRVTNAADGTAATDLVTLQQLTGAAGGAPIVSNATTLVGVSANDGAFRFVSTYRDVFRLDKTTTGRTAVADLVLQSTVNPAWFWVRLLVADPSWAAVADWKISPATGDNENDGTTLPLKTHSELARRRSGLVNNTVPCVITYLDNATEIPIVDSMTVTSAFTNENLVYTAAPVQVWPASGFGTIAGGALTTINTATNGSNTLTDATLPVSWTNSGLVGKTIHFYDSGTLAIVGSAHIIEDLGSKTCRFDYVTNFTTTWSSSAGGPGTVAVGNLFKVFNHVSIPDPVVHSGAGLIIRFHGLNVVTRGDGTAIRGSSGKGITRIYNLCEFSNTGSMYNGHILVVGCYFANVRFNFIMCSGNLTFCSGAALMQFIGGTMNIFQGYIADGAGAALLFVDGATTTGFDYGLFSSAVSGWQLRNARISFRGAYYGTGNTGLLIEMQQNNSSLAVGVPSSMTVLTSANPSIALAIPNTPTVRVTGVPADIPLSDDVTNSSIIAGA